MDYGCLLLHMSADGRLPAEFTGSYHVHLLVRQGEMSFSDGKNVFTSRMDDLVIWQMSSTNDTMKTLTEVSDLMHFENISHFSRYVKKTLGKTPSEYRNK